MSIYRRGRVYWYEFVWRGQRVREPAGRDKHEARQAEARRRLELAGGASPAKLPTLAEACERAAAARTGRAAKDAAQYNRRLLPALGRRRLSEISAADIERYQRYRLETSGPSAANHDLAWLRYVLRRHGQWERLAPHVRRLPEAEPPGREISEAEEARLLAAIRESKSPALLPLFCAAIGTSMNPSELRRLQRRHLDLEQNVVLVPTSKNRVRTGRIIPLAPPVAAVLAEWCGRLALEPEHALFPACRRSGDAIVVPDPKRPYGDWKRAWTTVRRAAGVWCRWYDLRHTFASRVGAQPEVAEQTLKGMVGHATTQMLERYSHARLEAKRRAVAGVEWLGAGKRGAA